MRAIAKNYGCDPDDVLKWDYAKVGESCTLIWKNINFRRDYIKFILSNYGNNGADAKGRVGILEKRSYPTNERHRSVCIR